MFFVSGITGKVGGAAARQLLKEGYKIRTLVRDPAKAAEWSQKGVDVRKGDFNDATAVAAAMEQIEGAFLMIPPFMAPAPGFPEVKAIITSFVDALRQSPPPRLVALSSIGSQQNSRLGLITSTHMFEEALGNLPFPTAFVRAGSFFENALAGLQQAESTGIYYSFLQPVERSVPMIATVDIGRQIAQLLVNGWSGKKIVELGSPVSPDDLAAAMTQVLGRPVKAQAIPREQWTPTLETFGMQPGTTGPFEEMWDNFNSGWIAFGVAGTEPAAAKITAAEVFSQARKA